MNSTIQWISVNDTLPELGKNVIVACKNRHVTWGMRAEVDVWERNHRGHFGRTGKKRVEWGQEENGFEYWNEIEDVVLWAMFPEPPCV